jgi:ATP-dependent DNA ligase
VEACGDQIAKLQRSLRLPNQKILHQKKNCPPNQPHEKSKQNGNADKPQKFTRFNPGRKLEKFISPMLASLGDGPFDNPDWIFELKWDGYRAVAECNGSDIKLYSRNGLSFNERYPVNCRTVSENEIESHIGRRSCIVQ